MFRAVTVRGTSAAVVWGYHNAAIVRRWTITKGKAGDWSLVAAVDRADPFQLRQRPLYFTAPRAKGSPWCFPIRSVDLGGERLIAKLGPPEQ